jgi:hypothetical protein
MRKIYLLIVVTFFLAYSQKSIAQKLPLPATKNIVRCYTVEVLNEFRKTHPNAETDAHFESWMNKKIQDRKAQRPLLANYTIPVIFHIIYNGEAVGTTPNLSAAAINQQILQLNKDYANLSNSQYAVSANTGIQFVLAATDTMGNTLAEPGIDRISITSKGWTDYSTSGWTNTYIDQTVKPVSIWKVDNYYNVWIVPKINSSTSDLLGYATFPLSSTLPGLFSGETNTTAGVVVQTGTLGSVFSPNSCGVGYGLGKTLSHETGHFLGLRHIWGDANCGDDYCGDTPVHFTSNSGVPQHPKSNSCGTPDEMFENYMDYSDDIVLNTFTTNQVDRMQTVMLNSPRRVSLATSPVGGVIVSGSNKIAFANCSGNLTVFETGANNGYPRYKDISVTLNAEDKATGTSTVTFAVGGTAVSGLDYELLTPSVTFASGDQFKPVNFRIFDNAVVDGDRTITLNYTISGVGVLAGASAQSVTITIADDDNMKVGENTINLLDEHFENPTGTRGLPSGWGLLTTPSYANPFVASTNGDAGGSGLCAHITNDVTLKPNTYTKGSAGAAVLKSPVIDGSAVLSIGNLSFKYKTRGLVDNDRAYLTYTYSDKPTGPFYFYGNTAGDMGYGPYASNTTILANAPSLAAPSAISKAKFYIDFYWETGTLTTGVNPGFNVDDILLTATPFHIETAVSSSYTYDVKSGTNVNNFKSINNNAIATISNINQNVNAITAQITQSGSGTTTITTTNGTFSRSQKVFQLSPAVVNTTATYQATFYFTEAELSVWATDKLNLKILKVKNGVNLTSALNSSNSEVITPVTFEDTTAGYISYTSTFTGFSQFVLVSPSVTLPVTLINFTVNATQNNIQLSWNTTAEINNRGFYVERSIDSINFTSIGWVNGNGTTSVPSNYSFTDNFVQPNVLYYYRLRQVDNNNREVFSVIRNAKIIRTSGIIIKLGPNPTTDYINLFISGTTNKASIEIINILGQKLLQINDVNAFDGVYQLPLKNIARGIYNMKVFLPEGIYTKKVIIQ